MDQQTLDTFLKQAATKPIYKPYLPLLKLARDCFKQNPIITYWTLCYVVEAALKNQTKPSDEFRKFLLDIMSCLEKEKKSRSNDTLFQNEKEAQSFIEEYGNKLIEKAEENDELLDKPDLAYKLYLSASNIFQMYSVFVRDDAENAKRVKFCKWKAVECFKKKKEAEEEPLPKPSEFDSSDQQENEEGEADSGEGQPNPAACPYPTSGPGGICPYPSSSGSNIPYPPAPNDSGKVDQLPDIPSFPSDESEQTPSNPPVPAPRSTVERPSPPEEKKNEKSSTDVATEKLLAALKLSDSDSKRAELLCESALYAIRANDLLTAVDTLKQTLDLLYKRARK